MILTWFCIAVFWILAIIITVKMYYNDCSFVSLFIPIVVAIFITAFCLFSLYGTEAGQREIKTFESNISGGIERTVTVYDVNGDILTTYTGKFDVDYTEERILFDDEDGNRHVIYFKTGTVIIDEN